jgi:hypothetical protein
VIQIVSLLFEFRFHWPPTFQKRHVQKQKISGSAFQIRNFIKGCTLIFWNFSNVMPISEKVFMYMFFWNIYLYVFGSKNKIQVINWGFVGFCLAISMFKRIWIWEAWGNTKCFTFIWIQVRMIDCVIWIEEKLQVGVSEKQGKCTYRTLFSTSVCNFSLAIYKVNLAT